MYNSIFQKAWWLDAVAPEKWNEVVTIRGDEITARLPYVFCKKFGNLHITMPTLTQTLGPCLHTSNGKYTKCLSEQKT